MSIFHSQRLLILTMGISFLTNTSLPAQNYTALRIINLAHAPASPGGNLLINPPSSVRYITDAKVVANGISIPFDTAAEAYCIPQSSADTFRLQVSHPSLRDHDQKYPGALLQQAEWQLVLPALTDLVFAESRQQVIYPHPKTWQKQVPAQISKAPETATEFIEWEGSIGGVFNSNAGAELKDYANENDITHLAIGCNGGCFFLAPNAGQNAKEFIQTVVSDLSGKEWTAAVGPLLYGHADGFGIMEQEIYIETTTMRLDNFTKENLLGMVGVNSVEAVEGRVGFVLKTEPGLGFDIVDLAARIQVMSEIVTAEAKYERIQTSSVLEGGEERW